MKSLVVGIYTWIVTVLFGAVLLDTTYAKLVPEAKGLSSEVGDFLLLVVFVTLIAAVGAIASSWNTWIARNYFIASLVFVLFEFIIPLVFSPLIQNTPGWGWTSAIRLIMNGTASILALIGAYKFLCQKIANTDKRA